MSEQNMRSVTDSARKGRQVVEPYQPVWMAHWMRPQRNAAAEILEGGACRNEELNCISRAGDFSNALDASRHAKELKGAVETKTIESVTSTENEFPCQETNNQEALRQEFGSNLEQGKAVDRKTWIQLSSGIPVVNDYPGEGSSKNPRDWVKTHSSATYRRNFEPFKETVAASSAHMQPRYDLEKEEFGKGKAIVSPSMTRPSIVSNEHLSNAKLKMLDQDHYCKNESLFDAPSTSDPYLPMVRRDSFQEMQKCSGIPLLPSQFIASAKTESKRSHYNFDSLQKLPNCAHNMETMRICTTVDSVEATPGGFPRFSKTTHSLLITKKADANLSKEVFRSARLITEMNRNTSPNIHSLWPFFGQGNRGVKLQPLSSSSNSDEKINVEDANASKVAIKNESSVDTDTMDICKEETSNPGANPTPSTKIDAAASREIGHHWGNTKLPDINLDLPALPPVASSFENAHASSSRTQSLEMDILLVHAKQSKRKLNSCLGDDSETDPIMRWIKRLKLRSPNSSTTLSLAENSSSDKMGKFFKKILDSSFGSSEPSKEAIPLDKNRYSENYNEELSADTVVVKDDRELLLSHPWIKRWLQNGSKVTQNKPETVPVCEPTSSKSTPNDIQNKQLPSIAAMALMGKALNGLQSCDLQKRGSFTIWNTQGILKTP